MSPTKMAACCVISSDAKVRPTMIPIYFARSPTSIFHATKFMLDMLAPVCHQSSENKNFEVIGRRRYLLGRFCPAQPKPPSGRDEHSLKMDSTHSHVQRAVSRAVDADVRPEHAGDDASRVCQFLLSIEDSAHALRARIGLHAKLL